MNLKKRRNRYFRDFFVDSVKARVGSASQVDSVQLGNPVLAPDFKLGSSWLHFYHISQIDSREHNLCPVTKQKLILKILDMIKFTPLNMKITFLTYICVPKVLSMIRDCNSLLSHGLQKILVAT